MVHTCPSFVTFNATMYSYVHIKCTISHQNRTTIHTYLSLEILQSMVVFLFVLTTRNGKLIDEFCDGTPSLATLSRFFFIRFLNDKI